MRLRLGTRGSKLAISQTTLVANALQARNPDLDLEIVTIKTLGDRKQGTVQASHSDKKDWIYDLELAILEGRIDFAAHSGKDVPSDIEPGTVLRPVLERGNPFDAFIGRKDHELGRRIRFAEVPESGTVGTASLRRQAQLLTLRPDLSIVEHRGNVPTRLAKLDQNPDLDGIVLACAGLERLGLSDVGLEPFAPTDLMPAMNQGTLVIQCKSGRSDLEALLDSVTDPHVLAVWRAERAVAEVLEGDCKSAISIYGEVRDQSLALSARVMMPDASEMVEDCTFGQLEVAQELGIALGKRLIERGAEKIIAATR